MKARLLIYAKLFLAAVIVGAYAVAFHYGHRVSELEKRYDGLPDTVYVIWQCDTMEVVTMYTGGIE